MPASPPEPVWLPAELVLAMHDALLDLHGGLPGVRDEGGLPAAVDRPRNKRAYEETEDLCTLAAAYGYAIAKSHPFNDGNKRTAFQSLYVFLGLNGLVLRGSQEEAVLTMVGVAAGDLREPVLADWLRANTKRRARPR